MKSLVFGMLFLSATAHADVVNIHVKNFNFNYKDPHGDGSASSFSRNKVIGDDVYVSVDKIGEDFKITTSGNEAHDFEFKNAPSFMTEAETMNVTGFNLALEEKLNLNLAQGRFDSKNDSLKLDGLYLDCVRDQVQVEVMDQLISGCIKKMSLKSSKFSSEASEENLLGILNTTIRSLVGDKASVGINSVDLKTSSGKYDLAADVKAQVSGKVKSNGFMSYDASKSVLSIKISEVKFGFLNVTGKVFDELKKNESAKLKVSKPYVYYTLK